MQKVQKYPEILQKSFYASLRGKLVIWVLIKSKRVKVQWKQI